MNKVSDQEVLVECDQTSIVTKRSRAELIEKFDDLKTPTGDDFESLIRSGFNQIDDPIAVERVGETQEIAVTSPLTVSPDGETQRLRVDTDAVKIDHEVIISATDTQREVFSADGQSVSVYDKVEVLPDAEEVLRVTGSAKLTEGLKSQTADINQHLRAGELSVSKGTIKTLEAGLNDEDAPHVTVYGDVEAKENLTVEGYANVDSITVNNNASFNGDTSAHMLSVEERTMLQGELSAQSAIFEGHVEAPMLGVGIDQSSTLAKLHIGKRSSDTSDLFRVDDLNQDNTPFIINPEGKVGVGTSVPKAKFHVADAILVGQDKDTQHILLNNDGGAKFTGSVDIEQEADIAGNLSVGSDAFVDGKLSVGAQTPSAKVDIQAGSGDLLNIGDGNMPLMKVTNMPLSGEQSISMFADTLVSENLTVAKQVHTDSAQVAQTLDAGSTTVADLTVSQDAQVSGQTRTRQLQVGETPSTPVQTDVGALINTTLDVTAHATFKSLHASEDISTDTLVKATDGVVKHNLTVGEQVGNQEATLTVKSTAANHPSLLVADKAGNPLLRIDNDQAVMGSAGQAQSLIVKGDITTPDLDVSHEATIYQADFSEHVVIASNTVQSDWTTNAKLAVLAHNGQPQSVDVSFFDGLNTTSVINATGKQIGLFQNNPQQSLHVGEAALFDKDITALKGVYVANESSEFGGFSASLTQTLVGTEQKSADLHVYGNTYLFDEFNIVENEHVAVNFADSQFGLMQLSESPVLRITNQAQDAEVLAAAGQLAINQSIPEDGVNLAVTGLADITGQLNIKDTGVALNVDGKSKLMGHAELKNGMHVSVTNNSGDAQRAAVTVSGETILDGELHTTGNVQFDADHTVDGNSEIKSNLEVGRNALIGENLTVSGEHYAGGSVEIEGTEGRDALTVNNDASFRADVNISGNLSLAPYQATARVHICETDQQALRIDDPSGKAQLVFSHGNLGLGVERPDYILDVGEDACFRRDLTVNGRVEIDDSLHVNEYASFRSNVNIYGTSELQGETRIGLAMHTQDEEASSIRRNAQLSVDQNHFEYGLAVYHKGVNPIVFQDGKVGIRNAQPEAELDILGDIKVEGDIELNGVLRGTGQLECLDGAKILGDVELRSDLTVYDDALFKDTVTIEGLTTIERKLNLLADADFAKSLHLGEELTVRGNAFFKEAVHFDKDTTVRGSLVVEGLDAANQVVFKPHVDIHSHLAVQGETNFGNDTHVKGDSYISGAVSAANLAIEHGVKVGTSHNDSAMVSINTSEGETALDVAVRGRSELVVDGNANVGIGCKAPEFKLDVRGDARVSDMLTVEGELVLENRLNLQQGAEIIGDCDIQGQVAPQQLQLPEGPQIDAISSDCELGGEMASDHVLATQAAVKAYVDEHAWRFGRGKKVVAIHNQEEFDEIFSRDCLNNMTILLFPHNGHRQVSRAYKLKNAVEVGSNLSIVGFNERETRIVKAHAGCRFLIRGDRDAMVKHVEMHGFTFDGAIHEVSRELSAYEGNGGAFNLRYADQIQLNCVIENHAVSGDGGAIYGEDVTNITANNIRNCRAGRQGGAAYGLRYANLQAQNCQAERGGAVAHCDDSEVVAINNTAQLHGGGAYKCQNLICKGFWRRNTAQQGEGDHIFSMGCYHLEEQEEHHGDFLWHALYLDKPMNHSRFFWRNDHV
ncbi:hypothetical protein [Pseudoalteromonas luteoviolacea]|uniref:Uncharacterized protein n=1 Tax=Pseudoalteromonas luteoviolacea S4054 TaxID=1129367 RepID=A0A0F6ACE7_9GAMM|nr:hypothetical protein [Pseudoalteromonas luteoviolacea]AOT08502.1 hypothetical protein S4054249_11880 [Pseudoalteromonas luteoviolacea]AOT13418.1 hypothetical protein S40542_11855 [Pseudoalteromonas luteoviolacea]AOT18331.1 hypothetical protein S4054_11855 [Pseudoalteromonas luteoviolacea]KKE83501.1 hypothetical protein N479_14110 [Pseudoalteromonas luteoviolacea S4054]KZN75938.1 hypothetical protein N481_06205 [Pseudoalteromonas luteoviolacea S4047-1]